MAVNLSPIGGVAGQFFDNNGNPLTGGKIYTYTAGTSTNQATYTSAAGFTAHTNPIILDAGGRVPSGEIWLTDGLQYKFVLKTSTDTLIGTYDNVVGINSNFVNFTNQQEIQTATANQTVFTLASVTYSPGTNSLSVFVDGVNQYNGVTYSYAETSSTVITFTAGLHVGALVKFTTAQTLSTGVTDSSLVTYTPAGTGAVATTVQTKLRESVSVLDFGAVGDGVADDTAAIQAAINYVSNSNLKGILFPAGNFKYSKLYCVYDAVNNPAFNAVRNAQILLIGNGTQSQNNQVNGTILTSTTTTGDCFIVSNYADDVSPWTSQEFEARDITWSANTTGFVVVAAGVVLPKLQNCKIYQANIDGSGLYCSTSIEGVLQGMQIRNDGVGVKTGTAIKFSTTILSGLFTLRDMNVAGFAYGFENVGSWENVSIYDSEITGTIAAFYMPSGTLDLLNIQGCYFEGACANFIKGNAAQVLRNLVINGSWFYSNDLTDKAISLVDPFCVTISGCNIVQQLKTFLNITSTVAGYNGGAHTVMSTSFSYSVNPVSPVYYFTGKIPTIINIEYPESVANCKVTNGLNTQTYGLQNHFGNSAWGSGHNFETATLNLGSITGTPAGIDLYNAGNVPAFVVFNAITAPTVLSLPAIVFNMKNGYSITITSAISSTQTTPVKTAGLDGDVLLGNLTAGQQRKFVFFNDGVTTGWN